jgi:hypothetical protein
MTTDEKIEALREEGRALERASVLRHAGELAALFAFGGCLGVSINQVKSRGAAEGIRALIAEVERDEHRKGER